jgi:hypothetical protein
MQSLHSSLILQGGQSLLENGQVTIPPMKQCTEIVLWIKIVKQRKAKHTSVFLLYTFEQKLMWSRSLAARLTFSVADNERRWTNAKLKEIPVKRL